MFQIILGIMKDFTNMYSRVIFKNEYFSIFASDIKKRQKIFRTTFKQQALEGDTKKARINLDDPNPNNLPGK